MVSDAYSVKSTSDDEIIFVKGVSYKILLINSWKSFDIVSKTAIKPKKDAFDWYYSV